MILRDCNICGQLDCCDPDCGDKDNGTCCVPDCGHNYRNAVLGCWYCRPKDMKLQELTPDRYLRFDNWPGVVMRARVELAERDRCEGYQTWCEQRLGERYTSSPGFFWFETMEGATLFYLMFRK
jgi:hypothetical protein